MGLGVKGSTASSQALEMKVTRQSWILDSRYCIPIFVSGTWSQDQSPVGLQIPWALFRIPKAQDSGFHKQKISRVPESGLDSGFQSLVGSRIPRALFRIPNSKAQDCRFHKQKFPGFRNSGFPYKGDLEWRQEEGKDLCQVLQMYLNSYQFFIYKLHCAIYLFLSAADHKSNMLTCVSLILSCYPCPWLHFDWFNRAAFLADYTSNQMLGNWDKLFANFFINLAFQVIVSVCSPAFVREFVEGKKKTDNSFSNQNFSQVEAKPVHSSKTNPR